MGDAESDEHLRIYKCLIDTGSHVLRNAIGIKVLNNNSISFVQYLETNKHQFYHQLENKIKTRRKCCLRSPHGCNFKGYMDKEIFYKMYNKTTEQNTQDCLDRFEIKAGISLDVLDLSDLNFFLWNSGTLSTTENSSLMTIMAIRRAIYHSSSSHSYSIKQLETYWDDLTSAVSLFAEPKSYKDIIELQIETLRKSKLSAVEFNKIESDKILHAIQQNVNDKTQSYINDKVNEWKESEHKVCQTVTHIINKLVEETKEAGRQNDERFKSLKRQIHEIRQKGEKIVEDVTPVSINKDSFVREKTELPDYPKQAKQGQKKTGQVTKLAEQDDITPIIRKKITGDHKNVQTIMPDFVIEAIKRSKERSEQQRKEEIAEKERMIEKIGVTYYEGKGMTAYESEFEEKVPKKREELAKEKLLKEKRHKKRRKSAGSSCIRSKKSKGGKDPLLFETESIGALKGQEKLSKSPQVGPYEFEFTFGIFHNSLMEEIKKLEEKIAEQPNSISAEDKKFKDNLQKVQMEMERISGEAYTDDKTLRKDRTKRMEEQAELKREELLRRRDQLLDRKKLEKQLKQEARQRELQKIMMLMDDEEGRKRQEEEKKRQEEERRKQEEELQMMFRRMRVTSEVGFYIRRGTRI